MRGVMMTCLAWVTLAAAILTVSLPVIASPVLLTLQATDFDDLAVIGPATALTSSHYNYNGVFTGDVFSQAFARSDGSYLYLYQGDNDGPSVLEALAVAPFYTISQAGWLSDHEPTGFLGGGVTPAGATYDVAAPLPYVSFNYPSFLAANVPAGEHTRVLYLISPNGPTLGEAYLIDSGVAVVTVVTTVPEPASLSLILGGVTLLASRRARRRRQE